MEFIKWLLRFYLIRVYSLEDLQKYCRNLPAEEIAKIFDATFSMRENRQHKSPRALEHAQFHIWDCC